MEDILIGLDLGDISPDPEKMVKRLSSMERDGFDCVEITLDDIPLIIHGEIKEEYLGFLKELLDGYGFRYTAHIGRGVDLRDLGNYELQMKALFSSIEACSLLKIGLLVLHYEMQSKNQLVEKAFLEAHEQASDFAEDLGITLCIENIEVERVDVVIDFVDSVNRKNFLLAFDTGHGYLASRYYHFDFLRSLRDALPVLGHVHLNDNTGSFEELRLTNREIYDALPRGYRYTFGRGDIHIPPFWGRVPFAEIFKLLKDYRGIFMCEYNSQDFLPFNRSIQERIRLAVRDSRA